MEEKDKKEINQEVKKLSYEQLEQVAEQLSEQTRQLYSQLKNASLNNMFKRLDYLFKVVENKDKCSQEFYNKCLNEVEELMTLPEEDTKKDKDLK